MATVAVSVSILSAAALAQSIVGRREGAAIPRTPWGDPDLQGTYTNDDEFGIPLERPARFEGKRHSDITVQELAEYLRAERQQRRPPNPDDPFLEFTDPRNSRAWLISDPADGKFPALTPDAVGRRAAATAAARASQRGDADSYEDRPRAERCFGALLPFPMRPGREGNVYEIVQAPGVVAIRYEVDHRTRVVFLDQRPLGNRALHTYLGDSQGRWDGNSLVVDTIYSDKAYTGYPGIWSGTLRTIERFTPNAEANLEFAITYIDPTTMVSPFTWGLRLTRTNTKQVLEYGCHEGNYGLRNILSGARAAEK